MSDFEIATLDLGEKADHGRFFQSQFQNQPGFEIGTP
jgi:hypothetical protein